MRRNQAVGGRKVGTIVFALARIIDGDEKK